jgi:hypothetical protein
LFIPSTSSSPNEEEAFTKITRFHPPFPPLPPAFCLVVVVFLVLLIVILVLVVVVGREKDDIITLLMKLMMMMLSNEDFSPLEWFEKFSFFSALSRAQRKRASSKATRETLIASPR